MLMFSAEDDSRLFGVKMFLGRCMGADVSKHSSKCVKRPRGSLGGRVNLTGCPADLGHSSSSCGANSAGVAPGPSKSQGQCVHLELQRLTPRYPVYEDVPAVSRGGSKA